MSLLPLLALFPLENLDVDDGTVDEVPGGFPGEDLAPDGPGDVVDFDPAMGMFDSAFLVFGFLFVAALCFACFVFVRNFRAAKRAGMDPFAVETQLAARAYNSQLLSPPSLGSPATAAANAAAEPSATPDTRTITQRLAEVDKLFTDGTISAGEHRAARDGILKQL